MKKVKLSRRQFFLFNSSIAVSALALMGCAQSQKLTQADGGSPVATIEQGQLRGARNGTVATFKRVPYAANPYTPVNRFKGPQTAPTWTGVREATEFGPMPPQPSRAPGGGLSGDTDDLTLNLWVPLNVQNAPVMVWFPGGAFYRGNASEDWFDGGSFANQGIMVVTVNYRVGIDGFMAVEGMPHNRGLLDQVAALQWIQKNISSFGGNPGDVTIAGQSSGAQSVIHLMGMSAAQGLYHKAIAQSPPKNTYSKEQAQLIANATAAIFQTSATVNGLANIPIPQLITATEKMIVDLRDRKKWGNIAGQPPFLPVVDGVVLKSDPYEAIKQFAGKTPLLIGTTDEEARLYLVPGGVIDRIQLPAVQGALAGAQLPSSAMQIYAKARANASPGDMMAAFDTDATFRIPALRFAEDRVGALAPVWLYSFAWSSPAFGGRLGAGHVVDVPFVFNTLNAPYAQPFLGGKGYQPLADKMHAEWSRFIKTGEAGWARYDINMRPTMRFNLNSEVVFDPMPDRRKLWEAVK